MSEDQINLLKAILKEQDKKHEAQIKGIHKSIEAGFDVVNVQFKFFSEKVNRIIEVDLNHQNKLERLEKETSIIRSIGKNPKTSILIGLFLLISISSFMTFLNSKDIFGVIKKLVGF